MARFMKKISTKAGLPPGTIVHIGDKISENTVITVMDYDADQVEEIEIKDILDCARYRDSETISWINVEGLQDTKLIEEIGTCFGLHTLHLEDIVNTGGRPKVEDSDKYILVVLKMLYQWGAEQQVISEHVSLIIGDNYVVSFQEKMGDVFQNIRKLIRSGKGRVRKEGADYLAYLLIDAIVDNYFNVLENLGESVEEIEETVLDRPGRETINAIHRLKNEMLYLRKSIMPLREVLSFLQRGESDLVRQSTQVHLRDVYDHTIQIMDTLDTYRDIISNMMDTYLTSLSNRMNEVMKFLTIFSTIFIPLTFLAGVYGMNFKHFPELRWTWGYPAFWLVSLSIVAIMVVVFRKKKWL